MGIESLKGQHRLPGLQHMLDRGKGLKLGLNKPDQSGEDRGLHLGQVANKALYRELLSRLNEAVGYAGEEHIENLPAEDYTPEAVASRILNVVDAAVKLARLNGGESAAADKLEQARAGISKGFNEARTMLEGMHAFEGLVAENANKTWDLLQAGLDQMAAASAVETEVMATQVSQTQSMELALTTRDGDKVRLHLSSSQDSAQLVSNKANGTSVQLDSWQSSEHLYISVEGSLDDSERDAINQLLGESMSVAKRFFQGDTQAAFNHLLEQGHDGSEIAGFALRLNQHHSQSVVHAYQSVNGLDTAKAEGNYPKTLLKPIHDYLQELGETLTRLRGRPLIAEPQQALADGIDTVGKLDDKTRGLAHALENRAGQSLSAFQFNLLDVMDKQQQRFAVQPGN